jgi:hypothetical protein
MDNNVGGVGYGGRHAADCSGLVSLLRNAWSSRRWIIAPMEVIKTFFIIYVNGITDKNLKVVC